ncbi:glycoside hydrolase family 16 protein [Archangium primigenium]|uniref:glycoside hydrolase family 16 protein n=1 Tax=[Archangium] primigenium TaxID=2792470 RepID=UPI00195BA6B5|nr:glycoside hydrolase family 16 protein [Archangium primigenium]MBM7118771.1 glycoside hydrolase family 16 protein [Archangium primigenium]
MSRPTFTSKFLAACALTAFSGCAMDGAEQDVNPAQAPEVVGQVQGELDYNPGSGWSLGWSDEFEGSSLNTGNWTTLNSDLDPVTNNCNFGTGEIEYPRTQNVSVSGGKLIIKAERTSPTTVSDTRCGSHQRTLFSGRLHTKGKVERRYGKIVASIKVPSGYGMWPAFWTLGSNVQQAGWPASGEIDILEWHSNEPSWMKSAVHWANANNQQADWGTGQSGSGNLADSFHTYEVEWDAGMMVFRLDGRYAGTTFYHNESEFQQNHYLILNLAMGGNWYGFPAAGSIALTQGQPKTMEVEWVRWYQKGGTTPPPSGSGSVSNASFESGLSDWTTWTPNGTAGAAISETYNGARTGSYHLTHWSGAPFETWTYQVKTGLANGSYKVRAWVRKGGNFPIARLQGKTSGSAAPVYTNLGTYSGWTLVETPTINVTSGYLEFGFHTQATTADGANFVHMDDVEIVKL